MEAKDIITFLMGFLTLTLVIIQFLINRRDARKIFVVTKRYEIYQDFLEHFKTLYSGYNDKINDVKQIKGKKNVKGFYIDNEMNVDNAITRTVDHFKPVFSFTPPAQKFAILASVELVDKIEEFTKLNEEIKKEIIEAINGIKTTEDCIGLVDYYNISNNSNIKLEQLNLLYVDIVKLMRIDLGVKY